MRGINLSFSLPGWWGCPKCSCHILNSREAQEEHNKKCTSTAVSEGAKSISDAIDKEIMRGIK